MTPVDVFRKSALFRGFTDTGLQILASIAGQRAFPVGVPLFVENMAADSLLVIAEGRVRLSAKSDTGEEVVLGELGPADFLGELSLIQPSKRMCTAASVTQVLVYELRYSDFQRLVGQKPQACAKLIMNIASLAVQKLQENQEALRSLVGRK